MQDCRAVTTGMGAVKAAAGTEKERMCRSCEGNQPWRDTGWLRYSPYPYQSKSRDLAGPQKMLNPLREPREGWRRDF